MPYPDDDKAKAELALQRNAQEGAFPNASATAIAKAVELFVAAGTLYAIIAYLFGLIVDGEQFDKVAASAALLFLIPVTLFFQINVTKAAALKIDEAHFRYLKHVLDTSSETQFRRRRWISHYVRVAAQALGGITFLYVISALSLFAFQAAGR